MNEIAGNKYTAVILLSCLSFVTTWIGVSLAIRFQESKNGIAIGIGFSAGIMILISLIELLPESIGLAGVWPTFVSFVAGIGLIWALNLIIPHTHLALQLHFLFDMCLLCSGLMCSSPE